MTFCKDVFIYRRKKDNLRTHNLNFMLKQVLITALTTGLPIHIQGNLF